MLFAMDDMEPKLNISTNQNSLLERLLVKRILAEIKRKRAEEQRRCNFDTDLAVDMLLEGKSLRELGRYFRVGHMTVATHLRRQYGRFVTNDTVTSCFRSLVSDYLHYKYSASTYRQDTYKKVHQWAKQAMLAHVKEFSSKNGAVKNARKAALQCEVFRSQQYEYYATKYDTWAESRKFGGTGATYLESIPSKPQEYNEALRLPYFYLVSAIITKTLEDFLCQGNQSLSA